MQAAIDSMSTTQPETLPTTTDPASEYMSDRELAQFIKDEFPLRSLVRVYYTDPQDGISYKVDGGMHGHVWELIHLKGFNNIGTVSTKVIWMKDIDDIEHWPDQPSPYEYEERVEREAEAAKQWAKSTYEEQILAELRAAGEIDDAQTNEGLAAGEDAAQAEARNANQWPFGPRVGPDSEEAVGEDDYIVTCGKCDAPFANLKAYWNHLDEHDMLVMESSDWKERYG